MRDLVNRLEVSNRRTWWHHLPIVYVALVLVMLSLSAAGVPDYVLNRAVVIPAGIVIVYAVMVFRRTP